MEGRVLGVRRKSAQGGERRAKQIEEIEVTFLRWYAEKNAINKI